MNNTAKKVISLLLCVSLITGAAGAGVYSIANAGSSETTSSGTAKKSETKKSTATAEKDETVYILANADGSVRKVIVSDWLKNMSAAQSLSDISTLESIVNVKGDEEYTVNDDTIVWNCGGQDIYYQGTTDNELPVGIKISYKLDGREISPEALAGKSGKVTIRFDYVNNAFEMREINGKQEKIYVPFAMLTGMLLDNDVFRNVEITNGKIINDGMRTAVVGCAFPGLQESLGIDKAKLEIPQYIELTADVNVFSMGMTATVASNEIFNELDTDKLDADNLNDSLEKLTDSMTQLEDGSSSLYDGLCELLTKSDELVKGTAQLAEGSKALTDGANSLDKGAAELQSGATQLNSGLQSIVQNNDTLNGGAKQIFDTLLDTANTQIKASGLDVPALTVKNYGSVLNGAIASLDEENVYNKALAQVTEAVNSQKEYIRSQVEAAVRQQVTEQVTAAVIQQMKDKGLTDEMLQSEEIQKQITMLTEKNTAEQMNSDAVKKKVDEQTELQVKKAVSENMASAEVQQKLGAASEGAKSLISLKAQLDSYNTFYLGLLSYTNGVAQAADGAENLTGGADSLKSGAAQLSKGADELNNGIKKLQDSTPALISGITQLRDGSKELSDGLVKFDEQGVSKLVNAVNGDITGLAERIKVVKSVSQGYKAFSGISDDTDGQVKFFLRTDGIE